MGKIVIVTGGTSGIGLHTQPTCKARAVPSILSAVARVTTPGFIISARM